MREKHEWHSIKIWETTYRRLKAMAALGGESLAEMLDNWSLIEEENLAINSQDDDGVLFTETTSL